MRYVWCPQTILHFQKIVMANFQYMVGALLNVCYKLVPYSWHWSSNFLFCLTDLGERSQRLISKYSASGGWLYYKPQHKSIYSSKYQNPTAKCSHNPDSDSIVSDLDIKGVRGQRKWVIPTQSKLWLLVRKGRMETSLLWYISMDLRT